MSGLRDKLAGLAGRRRGFRLSAVDIGVMLVCAVATWLLLPEIGTYAWFVPITLAHFFLFCNVFRISRNYELFWGACFLANVALWRLAVGEINPWGVLLCQTSITILLIVMKCLSPRYHGICCRP